MLESSPSASERTGIWVMLVVVEIIGRCPTGNRTAFVESAGLAEFAGIDTSQGA
jgi:hypothetical protein